MVANEAECANVLGASWWPGRFYNGGQYDTQEKCEAGLCVTGNIINFPSVIYSLLLCLFNLSLHDLFILFRAKSHLLVGKMRGHCTFVLAHMSLLCLSSEFG